MRKPKSDTISLETGMLSFARSLQLSEGLFWGIRSDDPAFRQPIEVYEKGVRGQSSEFKAKNPGKSNPQVVEAAAVPLGCDGVTLTFSMWIAPFSMEPWACGNAEVAGAYRKLARAYAEKGGFQELARLFLWNIANGRFAWRNRFQSDDMRVIVQFDGRHVEFDPTRLNLDKPASLAELEQAVLANDPDQRANVAALASWIAEGLTVEKRSLAITWRAEMREGVEVFPSQEYLRAELRDNSASRVYAKLSRFRGARETMQASMHSQKIGAALRHIDIWYDEGECKPIAVNPYGGVQQTGEVLRDKGTDKSFYELRFRATELFAGIEAATSVDDLPGSVHFFMANLVRGGVFGQKEEA